MLILKSGILGIYPILVGVLADASGLIDSFLNVRQVSFACPCSQIFVGRREQKME